MFALCNFCAALVKQRPSNIRRAIRDGRPLYCDRQCAGLARRTLKTDAEKRAEKAAYDERYRAANLARIKANKAARFARTYDPVKAAIERKARMPQHVEYCRRPAYRAYKQQYDALYRTERDFGEYAEAALLLRNLELEVNERASRYEVYASKGTLNKAQQRRRALYDESRKIGR